MKDFDLFEENRKNKNMLLIKNKNFLVSKTRTKPIKIKRNCLNVYYFTIGTMYVARSYILFT